MLVYLTLASVTWIGIIIVILLSGNMLDRRLKKADGKSRNFFELSGI
jgi:hypothetical protein